MRHAISTTRENESNDILLRLVDEVLSNRIEALEEVNRNFIRILRLHHTAPPIATGQSRPSADSAPPKGKEEQTFSSVFRNNKDAKTDTANLDAILLKARETRKLKRGQTCNSKMADFSDSKPISSLQGATSIRSSKEDLIAPNTTSLETSSKGHNHIIDIQSTDRPTTLHRPVVSPLVARLGVTRAVYVSQAKALSMLIDEPCFPVSAPFIFFDKKVEDSEMYRISNANDLADLMQQTIKNLQLQRQKYEKVRSQLERKGKKSYGKEEARNVVIEWFRTQKIIQHINVITQAYKAIIESVTDDDESTSANQNISSTESPVSIESLYEYPSATPIPLGRRHEDVLQMSTKEWLERNIDRVDQFHTSFGDTVHQLCETAIAAHQLRKIIAALKNNCVKGSRSISTGKADSHSEDEKDRWIPVLKEYRDIYHCLCSEASCGTKCIFLEKAFKS